MSKTEKTLELRITSTDYETLLKIMNSIDKCVNRKILPKDYSYSLQLYSDEKATVGHIESSDHKKGIHLV